MNVDVDWVNISSDLTKHKVYFKNLDKSIEISQYIINREINRVIKRDSMSL